MLKLTKNANGYSLNDNGKITSNLKVVFDKRKNCGDIRLPDDNSLGRKWISESRFVDGMTELDLENLPKRQASTGAKASTPKLNWMDYVTEEDKIVLAEIQERATKVMEKAKIELAIEDYKKQIAELEAQLTEQGE